MHMKDKIKILFLCIVFTVLIIGCTSGASKKAVPELCTFGNYDSAIKCMDKAIISASGVIQLSLKNYDHPPPKVNVTNVIVTVDGDCEPKGIDMPDNKAQVFTCTIASGEVGDAIKKSLTVKYTDNEGTKTFTGVLQGNMR